MSEKKDIKELKELFEGLGEIAGFAGAVMADGKVGIDDLTHLVAMGTKFEKLQDAFTGLKEVVEEAKDLEQAELFELITCVYNGVKKFEEAKA